MSSKLFSSHFASILLFLSIPELIIADTTDSDGIALAGNMQSPLTDIFANNRAPYSYNFKLKPMDHINV